MDEFGRLPDDVLKYISFLGARPTIEYTNNRLLITSPYYKQTYDLYTNYKDRQQVAQSIDDFVKHDKRYLILYCGLHHDMQYMEFYIEMDEDHHEIIISTHDSEEIITRLPLFLLAQLK